MPGFRTFSLLRLMLVLACLGFLPGCATAPDDTAPAAGEEASAAQTMDLAYREPITRLAFAEMREKDEAPRVSETPAPEVPAQESAAIETASGEEAAQP